jgi:hypothetical protein
MGAGVTKILCCAWERECRGLSPEQAGALWALTAAAECGWFGREGVVRVSRAALGALIYGDEEQGERAAGLVFELRKKGRVTVEEAGAMEIGVCFWSDRWARERARRRFERGSVGPLPSKWVDVSDAMAAAAVAGKKG